MLFLITTITLIFIYYNPKTVSRSRQVARESPKLPRLEEPGRLDTRFGPDKEEHDVAEEEKEEDEEEEEEDSEEKEEGGDSNLAEEEDTGTGGGGDGDPPKLPPRDGSIKFKGPHNERQRAVVAAFQHAWQGYRTFAWGKDHLKPLSKTHQTWSVSNIEPQGGVNSESL